jgi:hypothetical protein
LDIVANLVGILVILITVIGVRAQDAWVESSQDKTTNTQPVSTPPPPIAAAQLELQNLTRDVNEIQQQSARLRQLTENRGRERQRLQVLVTAARRELDTQQEQLGAEQRRQLQLDREFRELAAELAELTDQKQTLEQVRRQPIVLEHVPTPLAETVFGTEEHYRLKNGRLAYVPLNALTEMLRREAPRSADRLRNVPQITETIGPIQGFHLQYTLRRRSVAQLTKGGATVRQIAELERFVLLPVSEKFGEPFDAALSPDSQFRQQLAAYRPGETVITVWTYPDSFREFSRLKRWLFDQGFSTAARPLPADQPISGSPSGSRSAAQ